MVGLSPVLTSSCPGAGRPLRCIERAAPAKWGKGGRASLTAFVQLDQVLGLTSGTVEAVVEPFGAAVRQAGHDVTDVEALRGCLNPCGDTSVDMPRFRAVARFGVAADHGRACLGAAHPYIVGIGLDQTAKYIVSR